MEKVCRNSKCAGAAAGAGGWRTGWPLRAGGVADLCDSCGSAYEKMRFCELFHADEDGWKKCNRCKKRLHCGCIASIHSITFLDAGGIECITCANETGHLDYALNQIQQLASFLISSQRPLELPLKTWNDNMGTQISQNISPGQWQEIPASCLHSNGEAELLSFGETHEMYKPTDIDIAENNRGDDGVLKNEGVNQIKFNAVEDSGESHAVTEVVEGMNEYLCSRKEMGQGLLSFEEGHTKVMTNSCLQSKVSGSPENLKCGEVNAEQENSKVSKLNRNVLELPAMACLNISLGSLTPKHGVQTCNNTFVPALGLAISSGSSEQNMVPAADFQCQQQCQAVPKSSNPTASTGSESSKDVQTPVRFVRPPGEGRGKNPLLPRYWPRSTDQELQLISGDSSSSITPLFEKTLSASDAGRIGRLVLPKACAEAYFPPISQPEGVPLTVQDAKGKDWVFQFRYWPNNNSRMYVLEGVTACIQAMQLQAGDTVTFSRLDLEGKLVMGFRKASASTLPQEGQPSTSGIGSFLSTALNSGSTENVPGYTFPSVNVKEEAHTDSLTGQVNASGTGFSWYKNNKAGGKPKDGSNQSLLTTDKKRSRNLCAKSKRLCMDNVDAFELKMTWEEAQDLLHPPPKAVPSIVMIEGHEFEEYEEPPVLGKRTFFIVRQSGEQDQWAQCDECGSWRRLPLDVDVPRNWTCADNSWDPKRASCLAPQEISSGELEDLLRFNIASKKQNRAEGLKGKNTSSGLDTLANAVVLDENANEPPIIAQTTKHPRHRPGCTCIVCIQPPSGKGPKHKPTCTCNVCMTVKRRFKTLMMRRKKRQSEQEEENARKRQTPAKQEVERVSKGQSTNRLLELSKGQSTNRHLESGSRQRDESAILDKLPVNGVTLPAQLNLQGPYKASEAIKEEFGIGKGQIDLNCHPEHEEELSGGVNQFSMLRLLQDANSPLDIYLKQQGFPGLMCPQPGSMPMMGFQNNPSEQRLDEHSCILPVSQNADHIKQEHLFLPSRTKNDTGSASFQVSNHNL